MRAREARLLVGSGTVAQAVRRGHRVGRGGDHKVVQLQRHARRHQEGGGHERVRARAYLARDGKLPAPWVWRVGDGVQAENLVLPEERYHVPGDADVSTSTVQFLRGRGVTGVNGTFCMP